MNDPFLGQGATVAPVLTNVSLDVVSGQSVDVKPESRTAVFGAAVRCSRVIAVTEAGMIVGLFAMVLFRVPYVVLLMVGLGIAAYRAPKHPRVAALGGAGLLSLGIGVVFSGVLGVFPSMLGAMDPSLLPLQLGLEAAWTVVSALEGVGAGLLLAAAATDRLGSEAP
jgi:hypothetical protein